MAKLIALLSFGVAVSAAAIRPARAQGGDTTRRAAADTSMSSARADTRARQVADSLRREILRYSTFAGFSASPCGGYDLRTFERDSVGLVPKLLSQLELLVISYGVGAPLDNEAGRELLRAVVRLEAGGPGPRWDVLSGTPPRSFNPLLPTQMYDPQAKQCVRTPGEDPDGLLLPEAGVFVVPADSGTPPVIVRHGAGAMNQIRDMFFARYANDTSAVLRTTRVNAHALWGDYAIVAVSRERQSRGILPMKDAATGATYAFHRVGKEWRLLAMIRNWP